MKNALLILAAIIAFSIFVKIFNDAYDKSSAYECVKTLKGSYNYETSTCIDGDGLIIKYYVMD